MRPIKNKKLPISSFWCENFIHQIEKKEEKNNIKGKTTFFLN